ncbi:MAG: DHHA1 domain-containing protein, partial [Thermodesulfobacteriota bacterium]
LAPRINAAGRLDHARKSLELLLTPYVSEARRMAKTLDRLNRERQDSEQEIFDQALALAQSQDKALALVLFNPSWHEGVIGIVASRLARRYYRPVVMLCHHDDAVRGSARSIEGIDLYACLSDCEHLLTAFGGHTMAAGLSMHRQNVDAFTPAFLEAVSRRSVPESFIPSIPIDYELKLRDVGEKIADEITSLAPFGVGNAEPLFWCEDLLVRESRMVAEKHLRLSLGDQSGPGHETRQAIWFSARKRVDAPARLSRACFRIQWNLYRGNRHVQLVLEDMD